ncbi:MAG: hypothetical protein ACJAZA_001050 [Shewanella psychromarinicola]|jgi:hypothetical protein
MLISALDVTFWGIFILKTAPVKNQYAKKTAYYLTSFEREFDEIKVKINKH